MSDGYNVILGESNQGKTSILRAIRFVAECKPTGKGLIRKGTTESLVVLTLENGTIIERFIGKKDNGYRIFYPDGTISEGNTRMVSEVQQVMGWNNLQIGDKEELPINYLKQGDGWFLTSETATDKARILGALNNTDGADAVIKDVDAKNTSINEDIKHENIEITNLAAEIDKVSKTRENLVAIKQIIEKAIIVEKIQDYLEKLRDYEEKCAELEEIDSIFNISEAEQYVNQIKNKLLTLSIVSNKIRIINNETKAISEYNQLIQELQCIDVVGPIVDGIKNRMRQYETIRRWNEIFTAEQCHIAELDKEIKQLQTVDNIDLKMVAEKIRKYTTIKNALDNIKSSSYKIQAAEEFIDASHIADNFGEYKYALQTKIERLVRLRQSMETHAKVKNELMQNEVRFNAANEAYENAIQDKIDFLREHHTCPWCYSEIDDDAIETIVEKSKQT